MATLAVGPGGWIQGTVSTGGYPALAGLILAENLFPPIPSELILPLAGYYVGTGAMTFAFAVLAATAGSLVGALILYSIARAGGRPLILRYGRVLHVRDAELDRADAWFDRHGGWIVFFGRLIPGARSLVSLPAGLSEMPIVRFVALTVAGSTIWNCALIGAGWGLGSHYEQVGVIVGPVGTTVFVLIALAVLAYLVRTYRTRRDAA